MTADTGNHQAAPREHTDQSARAGKPPWVLEVLSAEGGSIPTVAMKATRGDVVEYFDVGLWPAGWRILRLGLTIPPKVRNAAIRLAATGTGYRTA